MKSDLRIVGLTGKNASGKGEASEILKRHGYRYRSLSDVVREEARLKNLPPSRENLIELATKLRRKNGPGVLAARTIPLLQAGNHVIDSIRHPEEIHILRNAGHFILIGTDAPIELRFARARKRGRDESAGTLEEFRAVEDRERTEEPLAQQLDVSLSMADHVLMNDQGLGELEEELVRILKLHSFPT